MSSYQVCLGSLKEPRPSHQRDKGQLAAVDSPEMAPGQKAVCLQLEGSRGCSVCCFPKVRAKCNTVDLKLAESQPNA